MFRGEQVPVLFLSVETIPATQRISHRLSVPVDARVISIHRLAAGAQPVATTENGSG